MCIICELKQAIQNGNNEGKMERFEIENVPNELTVAFLNARHEVTKIEKEVKHHFSVLVAQGKTPEEIEPILEPLHRSDYEEACNRQEEARMKLVHSMGLHDEEGSFDLDFVNNKIIGHRFIPAEEVKAE